jgi:riboflavin kinase/FMN adenylyltransferase
MWSACANSARPAASRSASIPSCASAATWSRARASASWWPPDAWAASAITSTAGRGRGYGQKYTVPTINLSRYDEMTPGDGVYITSTRVGGECFDSVTNIGSRPTFAESFAIETHLLNFHPLEVTAETEVEIFFRRRLRNEIKFPSVEALREQIARDVHRARHYFRIAPQAR